MPEPITNVHTKMWPDASYLSKLLKLQNQRVACLEMETNSPFCNRKCEALLLHVMESVNTFKFFKIISTDRKYFIDPIFFLTVCFETVPASVLCAPIKRRASAVFANKKVYTNWYFLARRHVGLKLGSSLFFIYSRIRTLPHCHGYFYQDV